MLTLAISNPSYGSEPPAAVGGRRRGPPAVGKLPPPALALARSR
jgi:hypothetical protein